MNVYTFKYGEVECRVRTLTPAYNMQFLSTELS